MQEEETEKLQTFTVDLSRKVTEISDKIKTQSLMLEAIEHQAKNNDNAFRTSQHLFADALKRLDHDKRTSLIFILLLIIVILLYVLKM